MPSLDNFRVVNYRRGRRFLRRSTNWSNAVQDVEAVEFNRENVLRKINTAIDDLRVSEFIGGIFNGLAESLQLLNGESIPEIICYGLGRLSESSCARHQLGLLLILKQRYVAHVYVYDPLFSAQEIELLQSLGIGVIERNEEGKRTVDNKTTLIYLPHCPTQLINNFLFANWGAGLENCIILSSSLSKILEDYSKKDVQISANYILRIFPYATEIALLNNFKYSNIFNDSSFHIFAKENLNRVPRNFWNQREEPSYPHKELQLITREKAKESNT